LGFWSGFLVLARFGYTKIKDQRPKAEDQIKFSSLDLRFLTKHFRIKIAIPKQIRG
jgi:hypothetical protein